jgi:hypothetical protein
MAKRYTDSEKWQDNWFTDLTNDQKIIWIYLLDHCDNAGLWKININNLNYFCSTNLSVGELLSIFNKRLTQINVDVCLINKFCVYQYGLDFLNSKNKAVESAINKLILVGLVKKIDEKYTLSIPYQYSIDTPKDKEEDKEEDKVKFQDIDKDKVQDKVQDEFKSKVEEKVKRTTNEIRQDLNLIYIDVPNWESRLYAGGLDKFVSETNSYTYEEVELLREFLQS